MLKRAFTLPATALAAGLLAASLAPVAAQASAQADAERTAPTYFAARLTGKNEVPVKGGPAVGDKDGSAFAVIRVSGNQVSYAVRWKGTATPTAFHIHKGKAGVNGDVKIGFFGEALPGSAKAVTGTVKVGDDGLLSGIKKNPKNWYFNVHTGEFPGGAVRAQLYRLPHGINLASILADGTHASLKALASGKQEVPAPGTKVGDPNGRAEWLFGIKGSKLYYATIWNKLDPVTNGHIHRGKKGTNGPVVVDLFADANGLPAGVTGIAGSAPVKRDIAKGIQKNPKNWYANLHTTKFGGGAVRGQLSPTHNSW
ncbi:hypothetical protein GCM10022226_45160 [Sphaerisporangium flaviroseum]|uniref:CHRD domain-containing protein n=1 Tax=Sphaerisporangium flaviroseum TaxID=509199 RepID=A0ABP7IJG6_9ACTN